MAIAVLRLSIISGEISQDLKHALRVIKELGAEYVELRTLRNKYVVELTDSEFSEAVSLVRRHGLNVSHICPPHSRSIYGMRRGMGAPQDLEKGY